MQGELKLFDAIRAQAAQGEVTIKAVIARRLAALTLLGRETPELPAEVRYTQTQTKVLRHFAAERGLAAPGDSGQALRTMAILAGYAYRPNGSPPGHQTIWKGWHFLALMADAYVQKDRFEPRRRRDPDTGD